MRNHIRNAVVVGTVLVAALACQATWAASKTVIALVDLSQSTMAYRASFEQYFKMILDGMEGGDVLLVARIAKPPAAGSILESRHEFPGMSLMESPGKIRKKIDHERDEALGRVKQMLKTNSNETPILDSLREAERFFTSYPRERKVLVIMSDMLESSREYDFERGQFRKERADRILDELKTRNKIAKLSNVTIYVAGARAVNMDQLEQVKTFWARYFEEAGARLTGDKYGPELLKFER